MYPSTLTFAATDTTSGVLARILFLLSIHQDVQNKLRQEITEARKSGDLNYDELVALPYLDAVCRETLRVYAFHPIHYCLSSTRTKIQVSARLCCIQNVKSLHSLPKIRYSSVNNSTRKDTILPLSTPITGLDGQEMNEILIPNNTNVIISIYAANRNPEIWGPDSYDWKPERWLSPLPETVIDARIPGVYSHLCVLVPFCNPLGTNSPSASMTFIGGARACM